MKLKKWTWDIAEMFGDLPVLVKGAWRAGWKALHANSRAFIAMFSYPVIFARSLRAGRWAC